MCIRDRPNSMLRSEPAKWGCSDKYLEKTTTDISIFLVKNKKHHRLIVLIRYCDLNLEYPYEFEFF